ncbi:MAG: hypothetical protein Q9183_003316 [Haloplaca sp. 2 TL-2023]
MGFQQTLLQLLFLVPLVSALNLPGPLRITAAPNLGAASSSDRLINTIGIKLYQAALYRDRRLHDASLVRVRLTVPPSRPTGPDSKNFEDFEQLELALKSGVPTLRLSQKYFRYLAPNGFAEEPRVRVRWEPPAFDMGTSIAALDRKIVMDWDHVHTGIKLDEADSRLKGAGFDGTYGAVEISHTSRLGLAYCFESVALEGGGFESVVVEVFSGRVRRTGSLLCP